MSILIYTDGAARGNPGPAAAAYIIIKGNKIIKSNSAYLGKTTNNSAEYTAIINALKAVKKYSDEKVILHSDSQLVIRQLNGVYQVRKKHLLEYFKKIQELKTHFKSIEFLHVKRSHHYIQKADDLCNKMLDNQGK
jgi:ribonuclease HI